MLASRRHLLAVPLLGVALALAAPALAQDAPAPDPAPALPPPPPVSTAAAASAPTGFVTATPLAFPGAPPPPQKRPRRSVPLLITGIVSGGLGLIAGGVGGALFGSNLAGGCDSGGESSDLDLRRPSGCTDNSDRTNVGIGLMIGGGIGIAAAIPLIIHGARREPAVTTGLRIGPGTATLVGHF